MNVSVLKLVQVSLIIHFKSTHDQNEPINCGNVKLNDKPMRKNPDTGLSTSSALNVKPKIQTCTKELADLNKKKVRAAFPFIPLQD